jgi:sortase A
MMRSTRRFLFGSQYLFLAAGAALLGYCAFVLLDMKLYQANQQRAFEQMRKRERLALQSLSHSNRSAARSLACAVCGTRLVGRIDIPRLGLTAMVMEGDDTATLRRALGHIPGTALPGRPGNVGIAGHRDTLFRPLRNIRPEDTITVTTLKGCYRYRVSRTEVVGPDDVRVLDPSKEQALTLVTCFPFDYIGPAPKRFVVRAVRAAG